MPVDDGIRNTTLLLILMCIPLIVASCQHTFGWGELSTAARAVEEQLSGPPTPASEPCADTLSPDVVITAPQESAEPPIAVAAKSGEQTGDLEAVGETTKSADGAEDSQEAVCLDATAEFEMWSVTLDDNIRAAVLREILAQLEKTSVNLDSRQAQLERLHVETELYRMQIQHLLNRRQEWESAAE